MATKKGKSASKKGGKARAASKKASKGGAKRMAKARFASMRVTDFAAKKPIAITPDGKFILPSEARTASFTLPPKSLHTLNEDLQAKLTLERVKRDPIYNLGIIGGGQMTKEEVIANVEARTEFGREVIRAEINYCNQLLAPQGSEAASGGRRGATAVSDRVVIQPTPPFVKKIPNILIPFFRTSVLFCEDTTDNLTNMAAQYRKKHVHTAFKSAGFNVIVLEGAEDVRTKFAEKAKSKRVVYISGVGHGSPTVYTGHMGSQILKVGAYDGAEVNGKVVHLLSCQTAKQLGPDMVTKKAKAYMGYFENFTFVFDNPNTPTNEIELFWKSDSAFDLMLAKGHTVQAAHDKTIATFNAAIASVPNTSAATWLTWDRDFLRSPVINAIYGSKTVVLQKFMPLSVVAEMQEAMG
jgi:hypothetical protein